MSSSSSLKPTTYDIFVGNLTLDKTEEFIRDYFNAFDNLDSVQLRPGNRGDNTNICFVRYSDKDSAIKAIESSTNLEWDGKNIPVRAASRGGNCWYAGAKRTEKKLEGHKPHKLDRGHVGHSHRPSEGASGGKLDSAHKYGDVIRKEQITVSFHESPLIFWGQSYDRLGELTDLCDQLQLVCPGGQSLAGTPSFDKIYASIYSCDGQWYRCKVQKIVSDVQVLVSFIDFGNSEVKNNVEIKDLLANLASIKPFSQRYCLYGLKPLHDKDSIGFVQGCQKFVELTEGLQLSASICNAKVAGLTPVILESDTADINQEMLNAGFAGCVRKTEPKTDPPGHGQHYGQHHARAQPLMGSTNLNVGQWNIEALDGSAQTNGGSMQGKSPGKHRPPNKYLGNLESNNNNPMTVADVWGTGGGDNSWTQQQAVAEAARLKQTALQAQQEAQQAALILQQVKEGARKEAAVMKREWDSTTLELEATKMTLRKLKEDYTEMVSKQLERSLSQRLARLVLSVEKVKGYRIQFPTEDQCEDPIEQAFNVASDSAKIVTRELPVTKTVQSALNIYQMTQNAIRASENQEEVTDLIAARDRSRNDLYAALNNFVTETQQMPLTDRAIVVEKMLTLLVSTYKDFLRKEAPVREDITSFDQAIEQYREWKTQKVSEFQEARTRTNTCHNAINNSLRILQEHLSLDTAPRPNSVSTCTGLDQLLDGLQEAVEEEAKKTNLVSDVNESDTVIVATLLKVLEAELRRELVDINHLRELTAKYSSMLQMLNPWLTEKPDVEPITSVRKQIKALKSKLRHKLADLQDMEENEDSEGTDMTTITGELADIRLDLHSAFCKEDELLGEMSELNETHFPELNMQYPEFCLEMVKQYSGLVKQGRALDQFNMVTMPNTKKKNIHKAVFCGKDVVIKEYIIDESLGVKKSDFLRRAYYYNKIINPHVLPIEALFFTGAGRQAYVMLPHYKKSLTTLVEEGPLSMEHAYHILSKVLMSLQSLHSANLVSGGLHPNNVLINDDHEVVLAELDFSKSPHQRVGSFTTASGLCFQPPEFQKQEISWASDMYNFGLLALWVHFPSYKFALRSTGVPDFSPLEMDRSLEQLLVSLLQDEPFSRRMATSTWHLPYFSHSSYSLMSHSPRAQHEEDTLQLRPKSDSRSNTPKNGGILKNRGTTSPTSSPVLTPNLSEVDISQCGKKDQEQEEAEEDVETPRVNGTIEEEVEGEDSEPIMNHESSTSTPVLICSPQGTPVNTPAEHLSGPSSPPEGEQLGADITAGLVHNAMLQASKLANLCPPDDGDTGPPMPLLEPVNGLELSSNEVSDLVAQIEANTMALMLGGDEGSEM